MRFKPLASRIALTLLTLAGISACNPALNWREVRFDDRPEKLLLPCKPERAERQVSLGETATRLRLMGCEAEGMHFTWSRLDVPLDQPPGQVLKAWQQASLSALGADPALASRVRAWAVSGARADVSPVQLQAATDSGPQAQFFWWVLGAQAHQLAVYSSRKPPSAAVLQTLQEGMQLP
ncbi:MAG: hypothetical protein QM527_05165 [Alphaproteobacteria bacterium]|nr:hypothetical protein [Alphaproteobacteria bacterium]